MGRTLLLTMVLPYKISTKLVFVPSSSYLSEPIYNALKEDIRPHKELLLYFNLPEINKQNKNRINHDSIIDLNDLEVMINYFSYPITKKAITFFRFVLDLRKYKQRIYSWLDQENPDVILTTAETISTLICLDWARKKNKLGIVIQPSFISIDEFQNRKLKYDLQNLLFVSLSGCRINSANILFGTSFNENFVFYFSKSIDIYYEKIKHYRRILIPNIQFQNYYTFFKSFEQQYREFGSILLCVQNFEKLPKLVSCSDAKDINKVYIDIIKAFPENHFIVKIHPRQIEDEEFYKNLFLDNGLLNFKFVTHEPLINLFKKSSLHISSGSYTILEAILSGVPSINIRPDVISLGVYLKGNVERNAYSTKDAIELIKQSMDSSYYNEFIERRKKFITESFHNMEEAIPRYILDTINDLMIEKKYGNSK